MLVASGQWAPAWFGWVLLVGGGLLLLGGIAFRHRIAWLLQPKIDWQSSAARKTVGAMLACLGVVLVLTLLSPARRRFALLEVLHKAALAGLVAGWVCLVAGVGQKPTRRRKRDSPPD